MEKLKLQHFLENPSNHRVPEQAKWDKHLLHSIVIEIGNDGNEKYT